MTTFQRVAKHVGAEPVRPFRISLASGRTSEIRHPEMVQVGRTTMTTPTFLSDDPGQARERQVEVSLPLTESIEPLEASSTADGA